MATGDNLSHKALTSEIRLWKIRFGTLSILLLTLLGYSISARRHVRQLEKEVREFEPARVNYQHGFLAGISRAHELDRQLSIYDIHPGSTGSAVIRVLGIPDTVEITRADPLGDPCEWKWTYGGIALNMRRDGELEGEQWLMSWSGPLSELCEQRKQERTSSRVKVDP